MSEVEHNGGEWDPTTFLSPHKTWFLFQPYSWFGSAPEPVGDTVPYDVLTQITYQRKLACGIGVEIYRDGVIILDFEDWELGKSQSPFVGMTGDQHIAVPLKRVQVLNVFLAFLYTSTLYHGGAHTTKMSLQLRDVFGYYDDRDNLGALPYFEFLKIVKMNEDASLPLAIGHTGAATPYRYWLCTEALLDDTCERLDEIIARDTKRTKKQQSLLTYTDLLLRSCAICENHDYSQSLSVSWSIMEKLLSTAWDNFIDENKEREDRGQAIGVITPSHESRLTDHRVYTAAVRCEVLMWAGVLSRELYNRLNTARSARNNWLHNLASVPQMVSYEAVITARVMLKVIENVDLRLKPVLTYGT